MHMEIAATKCSKAAALGYRGKEGMRKEQPNWENLRLDTQIFMILYLHLFVHLKYFVHLKLKKNVHLPYAHIFCPMKKQMQYKVDRFSRTCSHILTYGQDKPLQELPLGNTG